MDHVRQHAENPSIIEIFRRLPDQLSTLLRQQFLLAKIEMREKMASAVRHIVLLFIGGIMAYVGMLALFAFVIIALSGVIPLWLAALIVTLVLILGGAILVWKAFSKLKHLDWLPEKTIQSLKENGQWLKNQMSS